MNSQTHGQAGRSSAALLHRLGRLLPPMLALAGTLLGSPATLADDTEIFRAVFDSELVEQSRPKVLILFDNSGSMSEVVSGTKPAYVPSTDYAQVGSIRAGRLYWSTNTSGKPPSKTTDQWISADSNRCATSYDPLERQGFNIDRYARAVKQSNRNKWDWKTLSASQQTPTHVDCRTDITDQNPANGSETGNPGSGYPQANGSSSPYASGRSGSVGSSWTSYQLYTANYMNWYYSTTVVARSRIEIAQEVVTSLIQANPGIDFGLATFNENTSTTYDGGRIVQRIIENMTSTDRDQVVSVINDFSPTGNTPLCESTTEVYRYLAGKKVLYGKKAKSTDKPDRDPLAEDSQENYISPTSECQYVYVIIMTDGEPVADASADSFVKGLTGKDSCSTYVTGANSVTSCLPEIVEYMYTHDLNSSTDGEQLAITYTIGFATDQALLEDTARRGGGQYYTANDSQELADAFKGAITSILAVSSAFTAPAVAVDSFTRTESRDDVFFAMFEPRKGTDWPGNIKKLRMKIDSGTANLVDADDKVAIDSNGNIKDSARTYWSSSADGASVEQGGVGKLLADRDPDTRTIYTNTGTGGALQAFEPAQFTPTSMGVADAAAVFSAFGVADQDKLDDLIAWARGWTDADKAAKRSWMLGDMLHSRPVVLNYGARGSHTASDPDMRIVVGTNAGFLHMFDNADGSETWSFFPKELAAVPARRFTDIEGADPVWGVDGTTVVYSKDINNDGTIDQSAGDRMYLYFGLRRGGNAYYGLDVSNPDAPALLWQIDANSSGFSELGQSWSTPVLTHIPGYVAVDGKPKPVLLFGGGYDTNKDSKTNVATADSEGRAIYIIDAMTGALVWSVSPAANSAKNLRETGLEHSIPAQLNVLDSNGDGLTDRIYATDTGGNVWRVDLPGNALPSASQDKWQINRLAALNTSATDGHAGDRRFFYPVDIVRTMSRATGAFDAILIGSGDRENPNATDNNDRFYMLRDKATGVYSTSKPSASDCSGGSVDFRCKLPLSDASLYNATANLLQVGTEEEQAAAQAALGASAGWYLNLEAADGEKALAQPLTLAGKVFFTTFSPTLSSENLCTPEAGTGRLYAVRLLDATAAVDFNNDGQLLTGDRMVQLGSLIPDTPSVHFGSDKKIRLLFPSGGGIKGIGNPLETGLMLRPPYGTYWYNEETP